ncbi:hypothetical protein, partial [Enterocloster sp.]|uniref:hypothetical protein n=1 Tax=Enterocloster sp. TaxID=2719315 RepID=UPI00307EEB92
KCEVSYITHFAFILLLHEDFLPYEKFLLSSDHGNTLRGCLMVIAAAARLTYIHGPVSLPA